MTLTVFYFYYYYKIFKPLYTGTPKGLLAKSADPDQMPHNVASDHGLHFFAQPFSNKNILT